MRLKQHFFRDPGSPNNHIGDAANEEYRKQFCLRPACVEACPVGARIFGDQDDPESPISKFLHENRTRVLKPEMGTSPNVFYVGLDKEVM